VPAAAVIALIFFGNWLRYELRSYAVLTRFVDPQSKGIALQLETTSVHSEDVVMNTASGSIPARLYMPDGIARPPAIVVIHGIHHLGIDDPRFRNFSRALSSAGFAVLTPVVASLVDYRVDATAIPTIGESAGWLQQRIGSGRVTMITLSFSGGLALLAALNEQYAAHLRALVVFGAYDDLARVSRFLATDEAVLPDGRSISLKAHDYGASVFVYAHLDQFFTPRDLLAAHEALRDWLWERPDDAKPWVAKLSDSGRAIMQCLMQRRIQDIRPKLLEAIQADQGDLERISPGGKLADLRVPVFIVHGSADNVIPYTESLWLEKDVPARELRGVLITSAFTHVDPKTSTGLWDRLRLVDFIARILRAASN